MKISKTMHVSVVSPEAEIYSGEADMLFVRGELGEMGIAPGHLQLLSTLKPGPLRLKQGETEELLYVSGGILEVQPDCVTILADSIERPQDVNEAAALEAKASAELLLKNQEVPANPAAVQRQLMEATAKLQVLELMRMRRSGRA